MDGTRRRLRFSITFRECRKRRQSHLPGTHPFFISVVFRKKKESAISCERCGTCPAFDYASPGTAHCGPNWGELELRNVEFLDHVQGAELGRLIAESLFTVLPSHAYETLGKSILESYALGRPVVASDLGSRREVVIHRKTGLLFQSGNVEQLADTISFLYDRPEL